MASFRGGRDGGGSGGRGYQQQGRGGQGGRGSEHGGGRGGSYDSGGRGGGGGGGGRGHFEGRGDSGRGRGDFGRGGGGGGKNSHMGDIEAINALNRDQDADIIRVINPPLADRNREALVNGNFIKPTQSEWRSRGSIGKPITGQNIVRANHFRINVDAVPGMIVNYHVHIYRTPPTDTKREDIASAEDPRTTVELMQRLRQKHPEWDVKGKARQKDGRPGKGLGYSYDGRSSLFTTIDLELPNRNERNEPWFEEEVSLLKADGTGSKKKFYVKLTEVSKIMFPNATHESWKNMDPIGLRALETALLSFARWEQIKDNADWYLAGKKVFSAHQHATKFNNMLIGLKGYNASLKSCMAGLTLITDMAVNCFLPSGDAPELMWQFAGFRNFREFDDACKQKRLQPKDFDNMTIGLKAAKVKSTHLQRNHKAKGSGPYANSKESEFDHEGKKYTVAAYFEMMSKKDPKYPKLKYPHLPTVNIGSEKKRILVPAELIIITGGQNRSKQVDADITATMVRMAAVRPQDRMNYITNGEGNTQDPGLLQVLMQSPESEPFGFNTINKEPMAVPAKILPNAKLQYGSNKMVDPKLAGSWNMDRPQQQKFVQIPPNANRDGSYTYAVLLVGDRPPQGTWEDRVKEFCEAMKQDSASVGVRLILAGRGENRTPYNCTPNPKNIGTSLHQMRAETKCQLMIVMLVSDCYSMVKLAADAIGFVTQCVKWKNVERPPRSIHMNLMLKINTKLGGANHTLISRGASLVPKTQAQFQNPPASISWVFDKPCMLVGIDVSHPEPGSTKESMAAVVGSMDGRASQYCAHITAQTSRQEMVSALTEAMVGLLNSFKARNNNKLPAHIIVYRDGVSEGQFDIVIDQELPQIHDALKLVGNIDAIKVTIVVCQKGHSTRLVFEDKQSGGSGGYINPCPGLVVDASGGNQSIVSSNFYEFYLNSHVAIQGTCKPCKYSLIYDEIGLKLSEVELLTYWTTYLYARCNKSVSYATPAYYAHWASKRGKEYLAAGATPTQLNQISEMWSGHTATVAGASTMFWV